MRILMLSDVCFPRINGVSTFIQSFRRLVDGQIARKRGQVNKIANARERSKTQREERRKAQIRARVEHPFRVIKCQFGYTKVRFITRQGKRVRFYSTIDLVDALDMDENGNGAAQVYDGVGFDGRLGRTEVRPGESVKHRSMVVESSA